MFHSSRMPAMTDDITLLQLRGNGVNLNTADVATLCLPVGTEASYSQTDCMAAGWGQIRKQPSHPWHV